MQELVITQPYDMHVHFRDGDMLKNVVPYTARHFHRALVMPNLTPPIRTADNIYFYLKQIMEALPPECGNFRPLMTFKILPETRPDQIDELARRRADLDIVAGKVYPKGLTTNAHDGVEDFFALWPVFAAMQEQGFVLCLHGEQPGDHPAQDAEVLFLRTLKFIARSFPRLKIVLEHITTEAAVETVLGLSDNVAATITVHHLLLTLDDVAGKRMCPAHYCKPIAKTEEDRLALVEAATSGCPQFFFGSDSAPHAKEGKARMYDCCAGIFTAPVALPLLAEIFEHQGALDRLEPFVRDFGRQFYQIDEGPMGTRPSNLRLIKQPWVVPEVISGVVPFFAGQELPWQVVPTK